MQLNSDRSDQEALAFLPLIHDGSRPRPLQVTPVSGSWYFAVEGAALTVLPFVRRRPNTCQIKFRLINCCGVSSDQSDY